MKILLVGDYPDDARLGSAKVPYKLAEEFRALGHECDALFAQDLGGWPSGMHARFVCGPWLAARAIRNAVRKHGPYDVIDIASGEGMAMPMLRAAGAVSSKTAFISRSNGLEHRNYQRMLDDHAAGLLHKPWYRRLWYPLTRLQQVAAAAKFSDRMVVINEGDRRFVIDRGWCRPNTVVTIGHGVSSQFLERPPRPGPRGNGILFCGTWTGMKGVDYLVPAFAQLIEQGFETKLTILGGAVPAEQIRAAFPTAARERLRILDRLPENDVMAEFARHDVLVFPSTYEGFGMVVPEAMSQEMPVIATPVGCVTTLIEHGVNGWIVPPRDSAALAEALKNLLANEDLRRRIGESARKTVQNLTWTAATQRTLDVYQEALDIRGAPGRRVRRAGETSPRPHAAAEQRLASVGIVTCNREASLQRCVQSLAPLGPLVHEVIVIDNGSDRPVAEWLPSAVHSLTFPLRIVRMTGHEGPIVPRNRLAEIATSEYILSLDDDTEILECEGVHQALDVLSQDENIGAIAFAQTNADGESWPLQTQPAPVDYSCVATAFIGFAALLRRSVFLELGGYFELLDYYGEEKEYCLRLMHSGRSVVYLPQARIAHLSDPAGRSRQKYYRYYTRNDCLMALRNYPYAIALYVIAKRLFNFHRTARRHLNLDDPQGRKWLWEQLVRHWRAVRRQRSSVGWRTIWRWRSVKQNWPAYQRCRTENRQSAPLPALPSVVIQHGEANA